MCSRDWKVTNSNGTVSKVIRTYVMEQNSMRSELFLLVYHPKVVQQPKTELVWHAGTRMVGRTYLPLIFQPGSALSSFSAISSPFGPKPTTTSLLMVLRLAILGAPAELAIGPIAMSNGVLAGAAQS